MKKLKTRQPPITRALFENSRIYSQTFPRKHLLLTNGVKGRSGDKFVNAFLWKRWHLLINFQSLKFVSFAYSQAASMKNLHLSKSLPKIPVRIGALKSLKSDIERLKRALPNESQWNPLEPPGTQEEHTQ